MGLRSAINAKCRDCIHDVDAAGSAAQQIELCSAWDTCPLWPVRPARSRTVRVPYSDAVREEQGLTPEYAAWRLGHMWEPGVPEGMRQFRGA